MRLTEAQWEAIYDRWNDETTPSGETFAHHLRRLVEAAEGPEPPIKPDRRAEVLELAGRLAVANRAKSDKQRLIWTMAYIEGDQEGEKEARRRTQQAEAEHFTGLALAIINAVDEATGAKATSDAVAEWKEWYEHAGISHANAYLASQRAWMAARGVSV